MYHIAINPMATGKIPQGSPLWSTFNDGFVNRSLETIEFANEVYSGHAYTTWHKGRRSLANFLHGQHIAIDLDTEDERSSLSVLRRHPLYRAYGAFAHTTPSHTDERPRARVVFLTDEKIETAIGFTTLTNFMMAQFDGADTVCKDASRFFYGAENCEIDYRDKTLPLADIRILYKQWLELHPTWRGGHQNSPQAPQAASAGLDPALAYVAPSGYKTTNAGVFGKSATKSDFERAQAWLDAVDPWSVDYNRWIGILAAIKRQLGDAGLPMAVAWAKGKPGEVESKWKGLHRYAGRPMTLGSLSYEAKKSGKLN